MISNITKSESNWRYEFKYRLYPQQYYQIKNAIKPYLEADEHTEAAPDGMYPVRSLYFDTPDYKAYHQKMAGDADRVKFRLRAYANSINACNAVRVELKVRKGTIMEKHSTFVPLSAYVEFMKRWHWHTQDDAILNEFERCLHFKVLRPKILIEYRREGFHARNRDGLRITFDHFVKSAGERTLFSEKTFFRLHHPHQIVLEIKCRNKQPTWLRTLVQQYGLKLVANSKFTQGIEAAQPEVVIPAWSN